MVLLVQRLQALPLALSLHPNPNQRLQALPLALSLHPNPSLSVVYAVRGRPWWISGVPGGLAIVPVSLWFLISSTAPMT